MRRFFMLSLFLAVLMSVVIASSPMEAASRWQSNAMDSIGQQADASPSQANHISTTSQNNIPLMSWPMDDSHRRVVSFPNTAWTWNHLDLNPGQECPPFEVRWLSSSRAYWRNESIPEQQDRALADPGGINRVACYRDNPGNGSPFDHEGTDIYGDPDANDRVYAVADGTVLSITGNGNNKTIKINHFRNINGVQYTWQGKYLHLKNDFPIPSGQPVNEGDLIGYIGELYHVHYEVEGLSGGEINDGGCVGPCMINPWGHPVGSEQSLTSLWIGGNERPCVHGDASCTPYTYSYQVLPDTPTSTGQSAYPGEPFQVEYKVRNTGTATWEQHVVKLGTSGARQDLPSYFFPDEPTGGWHATNRIGLVESSVAPNEIGTFRATFVAPLEDGLHLDEFQLVADGYQWLEGDGLTVSAEVGCMPGSAFCDVPVTHQFNHPIECVADHKIVRGYSDGFFRPDQLIKRSEAARMITRWWKEYDPTNANRNWTDVLSNPNFWGGVGREFSDLDNVDQEVLWAVENLRDAGIISGFSDGTFGPELNITRAEALKMIINTLLAKERLTLPQITPPFPDVSSDHAHRESIAQAWAIGITRGYSDGTFHPDDQITRGEMSAMLFRALAYGHNNELNLHDWKDTEVECPRVPSSLNLNLNTLTENSGLETTAPASSMPLQRHTHCFPASSDAVIPGISGIQDGQSVCYWFDDDTYRPLSDVSADYWARPFIEALYNAGITNGCTSSNRSYFCPDVAQSGSDGLATRLQMAKFVLRGKYYFDTGESGLNYTPPAAGADIFVDVSSNPSSPYYTPDAAWVNELYRRTITIGDTTCRPPGDTRRYYCPNDPVNRTQMAYFILRTLYGGSSYTNNLPHALGIFEDVPANDSHARAIEEMYWRGFTHGDTTCDPNDFHYCPSGFVDRAHAAVFLVRAFVDQPTPTERLGDVCFSTGSGYDIPRNGYITPGVYGVDDEDIVCYHKELNQFKMYFNGSTNGLESGVDIAALYIPSDGEIWFSNNGTETIPGIGSVGDEDIIVYENGSYSLEIDGRSSQCLDGEDVDALHRWSSSHVYVSSTTGADCGDVDVDDEDIFRYRPSNDQFYDFFDGAAAGLSSNDINGLTVWSNSSSDANLYLVLSSPACLPSEEGEVCVDSGDIIQYRGTTGSTTSGLFSSYACFDNDDHPGLENEYLDAIHVQNELACVPPAALQASPPAASFEASPLTGDNPLFVTFTDTSTGEATSWLWDFGDGLFSTAQHPTHVYYEAGIYDVTLTVTGVGGTSSAEGQIIVNEAPPVADFWGSPSEGEAPLTVSFVDYSWGNISSWSWDFGDGSTSTEASPEHTYTQPGTYNVALTVNGPGGSNTLTVDGYITVLPSTSSPTPTNTPPSVTNTATPSPTNTPIPTVTPTATPPPSDQVLLALSPVTVNTGVGQTFDVVIEVMAGEESVDGAAGYLNFDPAVLQVVSVAGSDAFQFDLVNQFDNAAGHVDFAAGSFSNLPSGTFTLATVTMQAIAETDGSGIEFNMSAPRESDVTSGGGSVLNGTIPSTVIVSNAIVDASVTLQGRPAPPDARWVVPLRVSFTVPGEDTPAYTFTPTTDENGHFTLTGIEAGTYEIRVKHVHTLQNVQTVTLGAGSNTIDLGTLREGDANDDNFITIIDFSILAAAFGTCEGNPGYDPRADFNGDGCITIIDFSLLASNFGQSGQSAPMTANLTANQTANRGSEVSLSEVAIEIEPAQTSIEPGDVFNVTVGLEAGEQAVDGAQVVLKFDSSLLEVVTVSGGERLPQGLQNELDNTTGTLRFAAGTLEAFPNGTIELLEVEFRALAPTDGTSLSFGEGTDVTFGGVSVLGEQAGGTIVISEPTAVRVIELAAPATAGSLWALLPLALTILAGAFISRRRR